MSHLLLWGLLYSPSVVSVFLWHHALCVSGFVFCWTILVILCVAGEQHRILPCCLTCVTELFLLTLRLHPMFAFCWWRDTRSRCWYIIAIPSYSFRYQKVDKERPLFAPTWAQMWKEFESRPKNIWRHPNTANGQNELLKISHRVLERNRNSVWSIRFLIFSINPHGPNFRNFQYFGPMGTCFSAHT